METIYSYSRAEAIADGLLSDITEDAREAGFKYPIALTEGVESVISKAIANPNYAGDRAGIIWDILSVARYQTMHTGGDIMFFTVIIQGICTPTTESLDFHKVKFKMLIGPGDDDKPVITILLPHED